MNLPATILPESKSKPAILWLSIFGFSLLAAISFAQQPVSTNASPELKILGLPAETVRNLKLAEEARKAQLFWGIIPLQYELPLHPLDFFKREQMKEKARLNQSQKLVVVPLPPAAMGDLPKTIANLSEKINPVTVMATGDAYGHIEAIFFGLAALGVGIILCGKFVPGFATAVNRSLNPWMFETRLTSSLSQTLLADEGSVAAFQAILHKGKPEMPAGTNGSVLEKNLFTSAAELVHNIRNHLKEIRSSLETRVQQNLLLKISDEFQPLNRLADNPELLPMRQMTFAVDMLVKQLTEKAGSINSSTLRTLSLGVDLLGELCVAGLNPVLLTEPPLRVLVVDDETFSRYALTHSLKRAFNPPDVAEDGASALVLAGQHAYDLIFIDILMPGMDGFELCTRIHDTPANRTTPIVFVTSLTDFDTRANSIQCGGRDLIAKPFLTFELVVKALALATTERLRGRGRSAETLAPLEKVQGFCGAPEGAGKTFPGDTGRRKIFPPQNVANGRNFH